MFFESSQIIKITFVTFDIGFNKSPITIDILRVSAALYINYGSSLKSVGRVLLFTRFDISITK